MEKILISACLLGEPVRFDGAGKLVRDERLTRWGKEGRLVTVCPELAGGLGVPRPAAEIQDGSGEDVLQARARIHTKSGADLPAAFLAGAETALALARQCHIRMAILKENSPSCGSSAIHDGTFSARRVPGQGVTAALLVRAGIAIFSEAQLDAAEAWLERLESDRGTLTTHPR